MKKNILELNGLPGAGKTFLCDAIQKKFKNEGYNVALLSDYMETFLMNGKLRRLMYILKYVNFKELLVGMGLLFQISPFSMRRVPYIVLYWETCVIYNKFLREGSTHILIADEGKIQRILSVIYPGMISQHKLDAIVAKLEDKDATVIINCNLSIEVALERILHRKSDQGRIDKMPAQDRENALKMQQRQLKVLRSTLEKENWRGILDVDTNVDIDHERLLLSIKKVMI